MKGKVVVMLQSVFCKVMLDMHDDITLTYIWYH